MEPIDQPAQLPEVPIAEPVPSQPAARSSGFRRTVLTAGMAAALLIAGGVAAVSAASPDPSASSSPAATTEPSTDGTTAPSTSAAVDDAARADCPHEDADDGTTSAAPTPTPTS
jgi:hypothetical protein